MPIDRINPVYRDALLDARARNYAIGRAGEQRLYVAFAEALARIIRDVQEGAITPERGAALARQIKTILAAFARQSEQITSTSIRQTIDEVVRAHSLATGSLFRAVGMAGTVSFDAVPARALRAILSRTRNAATFQTLFRRRIVNLAPEVDRFVEAAVSRGVGAGRATLDLARILANGDARLTAAIAKLTPPPATVEEMISADIRRELQAGVGQIDLESYGIREADVADLRSLLYDARRIQVSETNNAYREANAESMKESPIVMAAKWGLSSRHFIPDECDVLATADFYGYGPGYYPPEKWPIGPHPFCGCSQVGPVVYRPVAEWGQPRRPPNALALDPADPAPYASFKFTRRRLDAVQGRVAGVIAELEAHNGELTRAAGGR